jgi:hypothetical protein
MEIPSPLSSVPALFYRRKPSRQKNPQRKQRPASGSIRDFDRTAMCFCSFGNDRKAETGAPSGNAATALEALEDSLGRRSFGLRLEYQQAGAEDAARGGRKVESVALRVPHAGACAECSWEFAHVRVVVRIDLLHHA